VGPDGDSTLTDQRGGHASASQVGEVTVAGISGRLQSDNDAFLRDPRFDLRALLIGASTAAVLAVGLATALLVASRANQSPNVGPTAATLSDAFATVAGACLGLLLGAGLASFIARSGSRIVTGILAGFIAYAMVLTPIVLATGPSDVSVGESFGFALLLGVPLLLATLLGSLIGSAVGSAKDRESPNV
jgi:hypothetical protein